MVAELRERIAVCPDCGKFETVFFRGGQPISNAKGPVGRGNRVYHCKCPRRIIP